ncbi:hypothetical protein F7R12_01835 [Pseudomonas tolaasii]|nr:hypothetical protein F7R12_01835 [Pseudomonas tolaasii]
MSHNRLRKNLWICCFPTVNPRLDRWVACPALIAGKPAPTLECAQPVGAGLPAMRPLTAPTPTRYQESL